MRYAVLESCGCKKKTDEKILDALETSAPGYLSRQDGTCLTTSWCLYRRGSVSLLVELCEANSTVHVLVRLATRCHGGMTDSHGIQVNWDTEQH